MSRASRIRQYRPIKDVELPAATAAARAAGDDEPVVVTIRKVLSQEALALTKVTPDVYKLVRAELDRKREGDGEDEPDAEELEAARIERLAERAAELEDKPEVLLEAVEFGHSYQRAILHLGLVDPKFSLTDPEPGEMLPEDVLCSDDLDPEDEALLVREIQFLGSPRLAELEDGEEARRFLEESDAGPAEPDGREVRDDPEPAAPVGSS